MVIVAALLSVQLRAQISVKVLDQVSLRPIQGAHVLVGSSKISFVSDAQGLVNLSSWSLRQKLTLTHVSYDTLCISGEDLLSNHTIALKPRLYELNTFSLNSERVETVFHSNYHYVHDYEILEDKLVLITFNHSLRKDAAITLCGLDQEILFEFEIGEEPIELIKDYKGELFLKTKFSLFRLPVIGDSIGFERVNVNDYQFRINNCVDSVSNHVVFNDNLEYLPRMNYYALDTRDSVFFKFKYIENEIVNKMQRWEYNELPLEEKRRARELAELVPNMDKKDVAAIFTGFHKTMYCEPVSAPLFVLDDSLFIFDHSKSVLYKLRNFQVVDSIEITYHKSERFLRWKDEVLFDKTTPEFYGVFLKNGYYYLKGISAEMGGVMSDFKVEKQFAENLKVQNGYAYYLYKKPSSPEKPFLYRELLS